MLSTSSSTKRYCCQNGVLLKNEDFSELRMDALYSTILEVAEDVCLKPSLGLDFSRFSNLYNNKLALAAVGVDNGRGGGWDKINGPHAVRITGRTYHKLFNSGRASGLKFFMYNAEDVMLESVTSPARELNKGLLVRLFKFLQFQNVYVASLSTLGI